MTRITNLGRKRTYLEAGFGRTDEEETPKVESGDEPVPAVEEAPPTSKKPRKRRRKTKAGVEQEETTDPKEVQAMDQVDQVEYKDSQETKRVRKEGKPWTEKAAASERRRQKRIVERHAFTTCLACRKQGHAVKNCPTTRTALHEDDAGPGVPGKSAVGICYRCGSTRHNLSRCKKAVDPTRPLPFASCFVCSGRGHLASSCPKNQGRGIYPNGGSCKLCGQTSHLAKDCELRTQEQASKSAMMLGGAQTEGGADEDDFHVLKRRRDAVQKEEKNTAHNHGAVAPESHPKIVVFQ